MTNPAGKNNGKASLHGSFDRKRFGVIPAILLGAWVVLATGTNAAACEPGANEVSFFQDTNYKGPCSVLGIGKYTTSTAMRVRNDSISSIKVGRAVNVTVCKHATYNVPKNMIFNKSNPQKCQTFKKSISNFKNQRIGNDSISSATIFRPKTGKSSTNGACKPEPNQAAVAVYQHPDYKGNCRVLSLGSYRNSKEMNFKNDSISSIEFGESSKARINICQHSNFKGRCEIITKSISSLKSSRVGNDQITSISVGRR